METTDGPSDPTTLLFSSQTASDPHDAYTRIRSECPVARSDFAGTASVFISRYDDVLWALRHPEVFSSAMDALDLGADQPLIPLQVDPPQHTKYRRLLNPEFVPRKIEELEANARILVNGLIDGLVDRGACDFHLDFATPLPSTIFLSLMGLPQSDLPQFLRWRDDIIRPDTPDLDEAARIRQAASHAIGQYFEDAIDDCEANPRPGLMSQIVHSQIDGKALSRAELLGICHLMLLGGLDTVTATLDCMITYLAQHPDRRQRLVDDPGLVPAAIEELLRHQTPVMMVVRAVAADVELRDVALERGDSVTLLIGAANGDPGEFASPTEVDFDRDPNRHLAFGAGNHLCLGAHLARLELRVALEEWHRRIPDYRIPDDAGITFSPGIRQADHLPLVW
jgi:cytochrome P450